MGKRITTSSGVTIGLDLGDRYSEGCALDAAGEVVETNRRASARSVSTSRLPSRSALSPPIRSA